MNLVNDISKNISVDQYEKDGFYKLTKVLTKEATDQIREMIENAFKTRSNDNPMVRDNRFSNFNFDIGNDAKLLDNIVNSQEFKNMASKFIPEGFIYTQGMGLELKEGSTGFPWHIGIGSFSYILPEDEGWSLWIPLDEIDVEGQGGGMSYVSESLISGKNDYVRSKKSYEIYPEISDNFFGYIAMDYDKYKVQADSFDVGDAFFFKKSVYHVSNPLKSGKLKTRKAFVMRFISLDSRLDKDNLDNTRRTLRLQNLELSTNFGDIFDDIGHEDKIIDSKALPEWKTVKF